MAKPENLIIWSVDAFEESGGLTSNVSQVLGPLSQQLGSVVQPVFVLSPDRISLPTEFPSHGVGAFTRAAHKEMENLEKDCKIEKLLPPKILIQNGYSTTKSVKSLVDHARDTHATLIAVGTHGTKGIERWLLGSFAETLLNLSTIPVLVMGKKFNHQVSFEKIIFATDFSDESSKALDRLVPFAKKLGSEVILLHYIPSPIEPIVQTGIESLEGGWSSFHGYLADMEKDKKQVLDAWAEKLRNKGISTETRVTSTPANATEAILNAAETETAGIICLASKSGPLAATLLGSVSRQVVRTSPQPVLIFKE